jgi:hypothetical protein
MSKWLISMMVLVAIGCARTSARAQPADPEPAPPPQANEETQQEMTLRLRELAERERAMANERRQDADEMRARIRGELGRAHVQLGNRVKKEKAAWLGVSTDTIPAALRHNLALKHKGIGLIVQRVEPKSPAADAGLEQYDLIEKLNDQWLVNSNQFGVLIRMFNPGDEITLSVIRQGQPQQIKATLAEKELPVMGMGGIGGVDWIAEVPAGGAFNFAPDGEMKFFMNDAPFAPLLQLEQLHADANANWVISDPEHTLKITRKGGKKNLEVSDSNGVVIFDGPIDTEEQRAELSDEVAKKLEKYDDIPGVVVRRVGPSTAPSDLKE